jgi:hypothetical protein
MAFKMQEMGIDGTGSHEQSDLASTMYWIDYPMPFLSFYYDTFPAVDDILGGAAEVASLARAGGNGFNDRHCWCFQQESGGQIAASRE